jgi:glycogen operon protein
MSVGQGQTSNLSSDRRSHFKITSGRPYPLGAEIVTGGVNFAVFSENATRVWLELFPPGAPDVSAASIELSARQRSVWHCHVEGVGAGWLYFYRMDGPYDPKRGHRFNRFKVLMDPYAKAFQGRFRGDLALHVGYDFSSARGDMSFDARDNADVAPQCVVVDDTYDWGNDVHPDLPLEELVIYETHVRGLTRHPSSQVACPGSFGGVVEKIPYFLGLGINAVESLPSRRYDAVGSGILPGKAQRGQSGGKPGWRSRFFLEPWR